MTKAIIALSIAAAFGIRSQAAASTLIDDFSSGGITLSVSPSHTLDSGIETGTMIGGTRFNYLLILSNPGGTSGTETFNPAIPALTASLVTGMTTEAFVRYGGSGEPDLNADLTGSDRLRVRVRSNDLDLQVIAFMTTIDSSNVFHTVQQVRSIPASTSAQNADFLFGGFGVDSWFHLNDVDQIAFEIHNSPSGGYSFSSFAAVPEPMSAFAFLAGFSLMWRLRRVAA